MVGRYREYVNCLEFDLISSGFKNVHPYKKDFGVLDKIEFHCVLPKRLTGNKEKEFFARSFVRMIELTCQLPYVYQRGTVQTIGITLRGERMYSFLDRFVTEIITEYTMFSGLNQKQFNDNRCLSVKLDLEGLETNVIFVIKEGSNLDKRKVVFRKLLSGFKVPFIKGLKRRNKEYKFFDEKRNCF